MRKSNLTLFLLFLLTMSACEAGLEGDFGENQLPNTFLISNEINRDGDDRFSSQISISWWGDDPDGFVTNYEVAIGDTTNGWTKTSKTDSIFVLPIPQGELQADVAFYVRSIDNNGGKDPSPAILVYPIKNSLPDVDLIETGLPPDTTYHIASFSWTIDDLDGFENIENTEIAINDTVGGWVSISPGETIVTLQAIDINGNSANAAVYFGASLRSSSIVLNGLKLNDTNTFYVRARDKTLSEGEIDSASWFMKAQTSKVLLLNDVSASPLQDRVTRSIAYMNSLGISEIDVWNINDGEAIQGQTVSFTTSLPALVTASFENSMVPQRTLSQWDHIYWVSDNIKRNINYAQQITQEFFENGGTMFITIPMIGLSEEDPLFNFLPVDSIGKLPALATNFQISRNGELAPIFNAEWPTITSDRIVSTVYPMKPSSGAKELYRGNYSLATVLGTRQYDGFEATAIENAEGALIYFGLDFFLLDYGTNDIEGMLRALLIDELGFSND